MLGLNEYQALVDSSVVLEQDRHGIKVLQTPTGEMVKLFRQKRLISSASFKSYATRFVDNAKVLNSLGINTVVVRDVVYCKEIKRTLVYYQPVPGETLRDVLQTPSCADEVMAEFAFFYAKLHDLGIYFRSIHLNNVVIAGSLDSLGLIDIADMKIHAKSLSRNMRLRNFNHLAKYREDRESIRRFGVEKFMDLYLRESPLMTSCREGLLAAMRTLVEAG